MPRRSLARSCCAAFALRCYRDAINRLRSFLVFWNSFAERVRDRGYGIRAMLDAGFMASVRTVLVFACKFWAHGIFPCGASCV